MRWSSMVMPGADITAVPVHGWMHAAAALSTPCGEVRKLYGRGLGCGSKTVFVPPTLRLGRAAPEAELWNLGPPTHPLGRLWRPGHEPLPHAHTRTPKVMISGGLGCTQKTRTVTERSGRDIARSVAVQAVSWPVLVPGARNKLRSRGSRALHQSLWSLAHTRRT